MSTEKNKLKAKKERAVFALNAVLLLLAVLIPFAFLFGICFAAPSQYKNTFLGELGDKYDRLYSIKEPKIVVSAEAVPHSDLIRNCLKKISICRSSISDFMQHSAQK